VVLFFVKKALVYLKIIINSSIFVSCLFAKKLASLSSLSGDYYKLFHFCFLCFFIKLASLLSQYGDYFKLFNFCFLSFYIKLAPLRRRLIAFNNLDYVITVFNEMGWELCP